MNHEDSTLGTPPTKGSRTWIALAAAITVVAAATAAAVIAWGGSSHPLPSNAVLRLDGTTVTTSQYQARLKVLSALYGVTAPSSGAKSASFRGDAAKAIAVSLILDRAALRHGIHVTDQQTQSALNNLVTQELPGGQAAFAQFLRTKGISQADVLTEVRRQLETAALFNAITKNIALGTVAQAQSLFNADPSKMVTPERRRIDNIVVATSQQAATILKQLKGGMPFGALARKYSLDSSTRSRAGDLGWMTASQLDPSYANVAFTARAAVAFGPVETQYGWNVGMVTAIQAPAAESFTQVESQLRAEVQDSKKLTAWRSWLAQQIVRANVQYASAYRPAHPDAAPSDVPTAVPGK